MKRRDARRVSGFGEDGLGNLYATSLNGPVYRLGQSGADAHHHDHRQLRPARGGRRPARRHGPALRRGEGRAGCGCEAAAEFLDITGQVIDGRGAGTARARLAPDYASSGRVFVFYTDNGGDLQLDEYRRAAGGPERADPATRRPLLTIQHDQADNHNGGQLLFGRDNMLYLSTGDGGTQGDPEGDAQNLGSLLGKVLRIDVGVRAAAPSPLRWRRPDTRCARSVRRRQRVLRLRGVVAWARCSEACTIAGRGTLRSRGRRLRLQRAGACPPLAQTARARGSRCA